MGGDGYNLGIANDLKMPDFLRQIKGVVAYLFHRLRLVQIWQRA